MSERYPRFKRWISDHELLITVVVLLLVLLLMGGRVFASEPCPIPGIDSALPMVSPERFEVCRSEYLALLRRDAGRLKVIGALVLLLTTAIALRAVRREDLRPDEDEGAVLPPAGRWPR